MGLLSGDQLFDQRRDRRLLHYLLSHLHDPVSIPTDCVENHGVPDDEGKLQRAVNLLPCAGLGLGSANKRLNTAYLLKESFGQLWDYRREAWARKFFENWRAQLKWQRLKPYEKFAEMIDRHWDGLAAYCKPENKVSLGFVEGFNNKIRVLQRRAYGLRDEEYLRLKILTCTL